MASKKNVKALKIIIFLATKLLEGFDEYINNELENERIEQKVLAVLEKKQNEEDY